MIRTHLRIAYSALTVSAGLTLATCKKTVTTIAVAPTCALVEVLHGPVTVTTAAHVAGAARTQTRIESEGIVATGPVGRAIVRTDDGLELRLAEDTEVRFHEGHPRVEHGRAFVASWGDDERTMQVGPTITLGVADAAIEAERTARDEIHVVTVRGEIAWRIANTQGRLQQGESLEGTGTPVVRPAGVWDDWTGGAASPQGAAQRGALGSGSAVIHMDAGEAPAPLALNEHHVSVRVQGDLAVTLVSQRFFNGSDRTAPVEYRVRLPEGAIVSSFSTERDGVVVRASPGAVTTVSDNGPRGALMASPDGGLYARIEPLAPGQSVRCELTYAQWLVHDGGRRAYVYPMGDASDPPFVGEFAFELNAVRAGVQALRGPMGSVVEGNQLRYARSDFRPRADLHIDLFDAHPAAGASARLWRAMSHGADETEYVLIDVSLPPPDDAGTDFVLLVDDSAGVDPGMLNVARSATDALLHVLGPNDRVALMFGDLRARVAEGSAGQLAAVSPARREAMLDAVAHVHPSGGTDLRAMLADAYGHLDPSRNGAVIYLGDAMPTTGPLRSDTLSEQTLRVAPDLRLYVIALGNEAHPEMLTPLADRGGLVARANDSSQAVAAAHRIAAHAMRPVYRDVTLQLGASLGHPLPDAIPQWVAGDPIRVVGELLGTGPSQVTVTARTPSGERHWTVPLGIDTVQDGGDVRRRWALARVHALEAMGASLGALADLGVRFGLITRTSALVMGIGNGYSAEGATGYEVAGSLWPDVGMSSLLPRLGVSDEVAPRGVNAIFDQPEYPMVTDDESGWSRHFVGENSWATGMLAYALTDAEPAAQACVDRTRTVRPRLAGDITVSAVVAADGRITSAAVVGSTLSDIGTESCIRRAVAGLTLPAPSVYGERPGTVSHTFSYPAAWVSPRGHECPPTARLSRESREVLWRERIANHRGDLVQVWNDAIWRCELRLWEDRAGLLSLLARNTQNPSELLPIRNDLERDARLYLDREVARRYGASQLWRVYLGPTAALNWDALVRRLADPNTPIERKIELAQAYRVLAPRDIDLRLRLMSLYEQAGRMREARHVADELRSDPYADTRVRGLVGEMLIRTGNRDEGLRALSEITEYAPYDTGARSKLGDLLITYGGEAWADAAYLQYQTLAALRQGDPIPRVRMAVAAALAHREDEALRILRSVAEDSGGDLSTPAVEALLVSEVARLAAARPDDAAVQQWTRVAQLMNIARDGGLVAQWSHPDVALELRAFTPGDTVFQTVGESGSPLGVRVYSPGAVLEGSRLLVRTSAGLGGARTITAHLSLVQPSAAGPHVTERDITLSTRTPIVALAVRDGALVDDTTPIPALEQPPAQSELY